MVSISPGTDDGGKVYLGGSQYFDEKTGKYISPMPPTPTKSFLTSQSYVNPVLTAPIDTILFNDETLPVEIMADLLFEDIGGQELINIARNDTVNGQNIIYQPIKNLSTIQQQYNPNNIVSLQATSDTYFKNFSIKFEGTVPNIGGGPNGEHVYIDPKSGDLIIEVVNTVPGEQIEVEIVGNGTIYEAEL